VEVTIEVSGRVSAARIVKSSNPKLNEQALNDAEQWVFESPIAACRAEISIDYKLGDEAVASHNNSLGPTPVTKARFVSFSSGAAQLKRWALP
jgi:TonB family protein